MRIVSQRAGHAVCARLNDFSAVCEMARSDRRTLRRQRTQPAIGRKL